MDDERHGGRLREHLVDLAHRAAAIARAAANGFGAGQVEHVDAIRAQAVEADDVAGAAGQVFAAGGVVGCAIGEHEHGQRELGLVHLEALLFPIVGERFVEPLEERAGPLGVRARRVVADDVVRRGVDAESGRQLGQQLFGEGIGRERLERRIQVLAAAKLLAFDLPQHAVVAFEKHQAVAAFDDDASFHAARPAVVEEFHLTALSDGRSGSSLRASSAYDIVAAPQATAPHRGIAEPTCVSENPFTVRDACILLIEASGPASALRSTLRTLWNSKRF